MEIEIIKALQTLMSDNLVFFTTFVSYLASWIGFVFMLICLFMFTRPKFALSFGGTYAVGFGISQILKLIIGRPRPYTVDPSILNLLPTMDASMPSGHTISATIMATFLFYLVLKKIKNKALKIILLSLIILFVLFVMFARQFLGQHYISDVFVGLFIGALVGISGLLVYLKIAGGNKDVGIRHKSQERTK